MVYIEITHKDTLLHRFIKWLRPSNKRLIYWIMKYSPANWDLVRIHKNYRGKKEVASHITVGQIRNNLRGKGYKI